MIRGDTYREEENKFHHSETERLLFLKFCVSLGPHDPNVSISFVNIDEASFKFLHIFMLSNFLITFKYASVLGSVFECFEIYFSLDIIF